jgi:MATE family multidrug resistance protein
MPSPTRDLLYLAWPILIAQLAMMANAVIDTTMAGHLSAIDLAAVGVAASISVPVLLSLVGVLLALTPIVAHLYGAGRHAEIGREIHQSIWISAVLALAAILLLRHPEPFIALSGLQPDVEMKVRAYLNASSWGVPAVFALRLFLGLTTGIGQVRPAMFFNLFSLALKVPMNAVFMYGLLGFPALGGPGCAVATSVDSWLIALLAWGWCLRNRDYAAFQLRQRFAAPERKAIAEFLKLGIPIAMTFIADLTAFTLMALFIARLGVVTSGAHQIAANLAALAFMVPLALGTATSTLVGQALGSGQPDRARHICGHSVRFGMIVAVALCLTCWFGAPLIAGFYTSDLAVQAAAIPLIGLVGIYHLGDALQAITVNALRGYKKSVVPMLVYAVGLWALGLGGGYALGLTDWLGAPRGAAGFWMAGIAGIGLVGVAMAIYLDKLSRAKQAS